MKTALSEEIRRRLIKVSEKTCLANIYGEAKNCVMLDIKRAFEAEYPYVKDMANFFDVFSEEYGKIFEELYLEAVSDTLRNRNQ